MNGRCSTILSALVDKSLVVADGGDAPRYRLLESARAFALEQLAAGETADTLNRHAHAMRNFLQRVDGANLDGELRTDQYAALVLPELDNLRAAHAWAIGDAGDPQVAVALAAYAASLIDYAVECVEWLLPLRRTSKAVWWIPLSRRATGGRSLPSTWSVTCFARCKSDAARRAWRCTVRQVNRAGSFPA